MSAMGRPYFYLGGQRALTKLANGRLFIVNTDSRDIATWIVQYGVWERNVDDLLGALVRPNDTVFDIGANMGYYTVKLGARIYKAGRIYSFEPNPEMFEVLADNCHINGLEGCSTLFQAAVGNATGRVEFGFDKRYPGGGQVGGISGTREKIEVDLVRIDDVVPADCVADLIKIDVEGFEPLAFQGMTELLARSPGAAIVMEGSYASWAQYGPPSEALTTLAGNRRIFQIHANGRLQEMSGDTIDETLKRTSACYLLMLPPGADRERKIKRMLSPHYRGARIRDRVRALLRI